FMFNGIKGYYYHEGIIGVSYDINSKVGFAAEYRYFDSNDPELTSALGTTSEADFVSQTFLGKVSYKF
ncbi:MAG: hypothetical protein ACK5XX_03085, partial [Holosporales bacterium]